MNILVLGDYENIYSSSPAARLLHQKGWNLEAVTIPVKPEQIPSLAQGKKAVILVRERTPLNADVINELDDVNLISQTGKGTAHIDMKALEKKGIDIVTTPGGSRPSVVELTIGMMIGAARQFPAHQEAFRRDQWIQHTGTELHGKQLGILGFGSIGRETARVAQALGMNVKVWRPTGGDGSEKELGIEQMSLEDILSSSNVISLHMRLTPEWRGFLTKDKLALMKKDAIFINTSRGDFVDETALADLLRTHHLSGAGLDVFQEEPIREHAFHDCDNVILTPHIGYVTYEVLERFADQALHNAINYFEK
ncbi:D-isomer specific 2-hydroxyacid dehydrogenase family protein [Sinobaca sp. H24]|uniref:NAD(P)-dependent oxidoreductase n=1 Tax=Sinobaca sp. H24 TaxID=2923376 RepID=UPI00207AB93F|nr:NAD(P)-dependent oxidoreductase [Sinobaca sp. H24]